MRTFSKTAGSNRLTGFAPVVAPVVAAAWLLSAATSSFAAPVVAKKADAFVDSIGVNLHLGYDDGVYSDFTSVKTRLQEMGIRHTRDGFENPAFKQYIKDRHNDLGRSGIKGTFISGGGLSPAQILESANLMPDAVEAIEGQNEILNIYVGWDQAKRDAARQYQQDLFATVNASATWQNTPVLGPTCVGNDAYVALGDLSAFMDYGNAHAYPLGPAPAVANSGYFNELIGVNSVSPGKQLFVTETGYTTGTRDDGNQRVSPAAAGKYAPRLYLENFNRGILRSFWYELADQGTDGSQESTFGLVDRSFAFKPQGTAIKNLTTLLKDATFNTTTRQWVSPNAAFVPGSLDYSLSGATTNVHSTLLQKTNGKFYLCLWQEVNSYNIDNNVEADINNPDVAVTVNLSTPIASAASYLPTSSTTASALAISNNTINLSVPDQVLIVELTPGTTTTTPPVGTGTGLKGQYFNGGNFNTLVTTRTDATVNFNWGNGSPKNSDGTTMSSVGPDNFSVRWTGQVQAQEAGTYTFQTTTDDGVRLYLDNATTPQIDKWINQGATSYTTTFSLAAAQKVALKMEYFDKTGQASARLLWKRPGQTSFVVIPKTQLYPTPSSANGPNLVSNPGFEAEQFDTQNPSGWSEWGSNLNAAFSEAYSGAHSGGFHGTHWSNTGAYTAYTYQTKTGLANGLYTLRAWVKNGGSQNVCYLEAKDFGGTGRTANLPVTSTWTLLEIKDINVSNGQATIGVWSDAGNDNWCYFDDFEFFKQS